MRRLNRRKTLSLVKELDAFPKVPDSYVETSASGGTVSLIAFTTMALLTIMEFSVYQDTWMKYEYEVDKDFSSKLRINIDITVAMKCHYVGADVLDLAETMVASADGLAYEPALFDLSPQQREWQRMLQLIQSRLQEEHSLQDVIFKSAFKSASTALPPREDDSSLTPDACRIHGHLYVNKVAGNFHITVGKAIPHPRGHAHLAALVNHDSYNFSHRIDHLSFGELVPGIINPLDGTEKIAVDHNQMFQYFITVVPTKLHTYKISADTHQFSVTERERIINHAAGSHGVSGIFMKYDLSSLMVTVTEEHMPFWQFFVRLCGIIGGIFSTTGPLCGWPHRQPLTSFREQHTLAPRGWRKTFCLRHKAFSNNKMLCNIFKEKENMRTQKHTYLKKKKQPRKTTNCSRLVYVVSVTNVLEEIMQLTGESAQSIVPGEDSTSDALPANRQYGKMSLEDGREPILKERGIVKCKCVRPLFLKMSE